MGGDRDREGFPSWNSVSRRFHCSRAAPGAGAGENSLDLVVLRCHGVFGVFEVWGVAGQPGEQGAQGAVEVTVEDGPGVTWGGLGTCWGDRERPSHGPGCDRGWEGSENPPETSSASGSQRVWWRWEQWRGFVSHLGVTGAPGATSVSGERPWGDGDPPDLGGFQVEAVTGTLHVTMEKPPGESGALVTPPGVGWGGKGPLGSPCGVLRVTVTPCRRWAEERVLGGLGASR